MRSIPTRRWARDFWVCRSRALGKALGGSGCDADLESESLDPALEPLRLDGGIVSELPQRRHASARRRDWHRVNLRSPFPRPGAMWCRPEVRTSNLSSQSPLTRSVLSWALLGMFSVWSASSRILPTRTISATRSPLIAKRASRRTQASGAASLASVLWLAYQRHPTHQSFMFLQSAPDAGNLFQISAPLALLGRRACPGSARSPG